MRKSSKHDTLYRSTPVFGGENARRRYAVRKRSTPPRADEFDPYSGRGTVHSGAAIGFKFKSFARTITTSIRVDNKDRLRLFLMEKRILRD